MLSSASGEKSNLGPNLDMDRPGRRLIFLLILPFCTPITVAPVPDVEIDRFSKIDLQNEFPGSFVPVINSQKFV